ncbi:MAG: hypothetical protein AB7L09_00500 [Nitrospira sp.]
MDEAVRRLRTVSAQQAAEAALKGGYPITCATCEHLKAAFDADAPNCGKMLTCGGPIFNRSYPDYIGPLQPDHYEKICLKCGSSDVYYFVYGGVRRFGLCATHRTIFDKVDGPGVHQPFVMRVPSRPL